MISGVNIFRQREANRSSLLTSHEESKEPTPFSTISDTVGVEGKQRHEKEDPICQLLNLNQIKGREEIAKPQFIKEEKDIQGLIGGTYVINSQKTKIDKKTKKAKKDDGVKNVKKDNNDTESLVRDNSNF